MHYEGTFNKYAMMEEMSVYGIHDKSLRKLRREGMIRLICQLLIYYVVHVGEGESNMAYAL